MSGPGLLELLLLVDTTQADAELDRMEKEVDIFTRNWAATRQDTLQEMRNVQRGMNYLLQTIRYGFRIFGQTMDPLFAALLGALGAAFGLMLAVGAAMESTLFPPFVVWGIALQSVGFGIAIGETVVLAMKKEEIQQIINDAIQRIRAPVGGIFGGSL
jgi:hypothetical protein